MTDLQKIMEAFPVSNLFQGAKWEETDKFFLINLDNTVGVGSELEEEISIINKRDCGFELEWGLEDEHIEPFDSIDELCEELCTRFSSFG